MKKFLVSLFVLVLCASFVLPVAASTELPPSLPSSFYGFVVGAFPGTPITIRYGTVTVVTRTFLAFDKNTQKIQSVYSVDLMGGTEGQIVKFYSGQWLLSSNVYHVGTNRRIDLMLFVWGRLVPVPTYK